MSYFEFTFKLNPVLPAREVLVADLAERGFESFVETEDGVMAYIKEESADAALLTDLFIGDMDDLEWSVNHRKIEDQNWNAVWESSFDPIVVDDQLLIRAPFHPGQNHLPLEIVIEPKMSFGTGHHSTTYLIASEMLRMEWKHKKVLDMGSGTAVLALLAEKLGAQHVDAIDIDEWAYENAIENVARNDGHRTEVFLGGAELLVDQQYDTVLANINRNILVNDMAAYAKVMKPHAEILFSGFYPSDRPLIEAAAQGCGLRFVSESTRNEWCMLRFIKF